MDERPNNIAVETDNKEEVKIDTKEEVKIDTKEDTKEKSDIDLKELNELRAIKAKKLEQLERRREGAKKARAKKMLKKKTETKTKSKTPDNDSKDIESGGMSFKDVIEMAFPLVMIGGTGYIGYKFLTKKKDPLNESIKESNPIQETSPSKISEPSVPKLNYF